MLLLNGDCLELLKELPDESIDLIFCDLPYGQTSCKWDCKIDLEKLWIEFMRVKKLRTPLFFTTTTKFGVELIKSAPEKCFFRYDLVWVKSAPVGFLSARRMPMRKHEMVYVFYEKLPLYDLSSHKHKFIKDNRKKIDKDNIYGTSIHPDGKCGSYDPPLPVSVVKEPLKYDQEYNSDLYGDVKRNDYAKKGRKSSESAYEPPLPTSVVKEDCYEKGKTDDSLRAGHRDKKYDPPLPTSVVKEDYGVGGTQKYFNEYNETHGMTKHQGGKRFDPPLPTSVVKEPEPEPEEIPQNQYNHNEEQIYNADYLEKKIDFKGRKGGGMYDPPLPTSVVKEATMINGTLGGAYDARWHRDKKYDPPLPTSVVKEPEPEPEPEEVKMMNEGIIYNGGNPLKIRPNYSEDYDGKNTYDPPLPTTMLEIKSTRGKHSTEKPVALMEWILKYYSKEGDVVLDPTMGSGSTGVACQRMNRDFVGFEMDAEIFDSAWQRLEE